MGKEFLEKKIKEVKAAFLEKSRLINSRLLKLNIIKNSIQQLVESLEAHLLAQAHHLVRH